MATGFVIEKDLGKAPLGQVWAGRDRLSDLPVVIKKIPLAAIGGGTNGWARHIDEIRTLTRLSLPQIATVLEVGEEGDQLVMVTEKPPGRPLSSVKKDRDRVGYEDLKRWILPVIEALGVAHDAGILHRQVHEDLIVVDENSTPVLTGFGLTVDRRVNQDRIPPEILSTGSATKLSDQFMLGAMVGRLLADDQMSDPTPALDALGTIRLQQGLSDEASTLFERALTYRAAEGLYYKLSLAQASAGNNEQAMRTLNEGLRLFPESERLQEARFHLGGV